MMVLYILLQYGEWSGQELLIHDKYCVFWDQMNMLSEISMLLSPRNSSHSTWIRATRIQGRCKWQSVVRGKGSALQSGRSAVSLPHHEVACDGSTEPTWEATGRGPVERERHGDRDTLSLSNQSCRNGTKQMDLNVQDKLWYVFTRLDSETFLLWQMTRNSDQDPPSDNGKYLKLCSEGLACFGECLLNVLTFCRISCTV